MPARTEATGGAVEQPEGGRRARLDARTRSYAVGLADPAGPATDDSPPKREGTATVPSVTAVGTEHRLGRLRIAHLYPLLVLSALGVWVGVFPLAPLDFWWRLRAGELIWEQGCVPVTSLFSWSLPPETPYVSGAWLGIVAMPVLVGALGTVRAPQPTRPRRSSRPRIHRSPPRNTLGRIPAEGSSTRWATAAT